MTRMLKATFDGKALVPSEETGLVAGQLVDVEIHSAEDELVLGSAASARRLFEKLRKTPKLGAEAMQEFDEALGDGLEPRGEIAPFWRELEAERRERAEREGDTLPR